MPDFACIGSMPLVVQVAARGPVRSTPRMNRVVIARILMKLGVRDRVKVVIVAYEAGI